MLIKNPSACIGMYHVKSVDALAYWLSGGDGCDKPLLKSACVTDPSVDLVNKQSRGGR